MAPSASMRELILEYLRTTTLAAITAGSSYTNTIKTLERGRRNPQSMGDHEFPALFIATSHEKRKNLEQVDFESALQVVIVGYVKTTKASPGASGTGVQKDLDKLIQDTVHALEADPFLGGDKNVKWIEITDIATDEGDLTPWGGFVLSANIEYVSRRQTP